MTQNGEDKGRTGAFSQPHVGYEKDIMAEGWDLSQTHVDNLAENALKVSEEKGSDNFIMGRSVDNSSSKQADKVPANFTSGTTEYSDPKYQPVK